VHRAMKRVGVNSRAEAVALAISFGDQDLAEIA
jgi:DNA-binding CsgD family transcriptional regulator